MTKNEMYKILTNVPSGAHFVTIFLNNHKSITFIKDIILDKNNFVYDNKSYSYSDIITYSYEA